MKISNRLAELYINRFSIRLGKRKGLLVEGENLKTDRLHKHFLSDEFIDSLDDKTQNKIMKIKRENKDAKEYVVSLYEKVREILSEKELKEHEKKANEALNKLSHSRDFRISNIHRFRDFRYDRVYAFYDAKNDKAVTLSNEFWLEFCYPSSDKDDKQKYIYDHTFSGLLEYNPYNPLTVQEYEYEGRETQLLNTYIRPSWMSVEVIPDSLPELFDKFLDHFADNEGSKNAMVHWLYWMLKERSEVYLVLNSVQGTGKGLFSQFVKGLAGDSNYFESSENFFKSQFNTDIKDKRAVFFDEVAITRNNIDTLKKQVNQFNRIEQKGVDASQYENFASFIIASNHESNCYFTQTERRFSVPELTNRRLEDSFSSADRRKLFAMTKDKEVLAQIANWILNQGQINGEDNFYSYKGAKYFNICLHSLGEAKRFVVDRIITSGMVESVGDVKAEYKELTGNHRFLVSKTIGELLDEFYDFEGDRYGSLKKIGDEWSIVPSNKYLKEVDEKEVW